MTTAQLFANMRFLENSMVTGYGAGRRRTCIVCNSVVRKGTGQRMLPIVGRVYVCHKKSCQMRYEELRQTPDSTQVWEALFV